MPDLERNPLADLDADETAGRLVDIVGQEAHRTLSQRQLQPDPKLVAEGWERRFITDSRRVKEVTALYEELGFEIHLEPVQSENFDDDCQDCGLVAFLKFVTLYTRKK